MPTKPYKFQDEDAIAIEAMHGRSLLASEMGVGKSLTALLWANRNPEVRPIVIVCPASLKYNWQRECEVHYGWYSEVLSGTKVTDDAPILMPGIVIINYDILGTWLPYLKSIEPKLIIGDEVHYITNRDNKRTKLMTSLCDGVPHVILLSGTPLTNRPLELYPSLSILRPDVFGDFSTYAQEFCDPKLEKTGRWNLRGASNLDVLHRKLKKHVMIRRRKKDVLPFLPEKTRTVIIQEMTKEGRKEYNRAKTDFIKWLSSVSSRKANKAKKAKELLQVNYLKRLATAGRETNSIEWLEDQLVSSGGKIVAFCVHRKLIKKIKERHKGRCVSIDGNTPIKERQRAVDLFQGTDKIKLFVGNIKAAGVGITLTEANTVAFLELGWTPGEHIQAEDRAHRIGQRSHTSVYYLVAKDTIETRICELLQRKQKILSATLDGGSLPGDLNVYDELIKIIRKETK